MARVSISSRSSGASMWAAVWLADKLREELGEPVTVTHVDPLVPRPLRAQAIGDALQGCQVLIALIGADWMKTDECLDGVDDTRRLEDAHDHVRLEIATALGLGIDLIPVLLDGVPMPAATDLPEELRPLVRRHSVGLSLGQSDADAGRLAARLGTLLGLSAARRRRRFTILGAVGAVGLISVAAFLILRASAPSPPLPAGVRAAVDLNARTGAIAVGQDAIWVADGLEGQVLRIDPDSLAVISRTTVGPDPMAMAVTDDAVWVANGGDGTVSRIDVETAEVVATIIVGFPSQQQLAFFSARVSIAATDDAVWLTGEGIEGLRRIDATTNEQSTIDMPSRRTPWSMDASGRSVWIIDALEGTLTRIDATTGASSEIHLGPNPQLVSAGETAVWVTTKNDTLVHVEPGTTALDAVIGSRTARTVTDLAVTDDAVWIIAEDGALVNFQPDVAGGTYRTRTIEPPRPTGSRSIEARPAIDAAEDGSAWAVTDRGMLVHAEGVDG